MCCGLHVYLQDLKCSKCSCSPLASKDNSPPMYEVLFDEDFLGGLKLRCSSNRAYRLPASCLLSISHGKRVEENKKGKSHKGYTQSGTSYASAAAHNQYAQPLTYGGNVQGQSRPYRYSEHQSFADSPRPRVSYDDQSARNVRLPKSGRGSTSGRGRGDRASEVKKIMQRDSSEFTQPIKQSTKESSHDELSSAMDALSKLSTQPPKLMQKPEPTEQTDRDEKRELSPSVAAMFSAHEKQAASSQESSTQLAGGVSSAQDQTSNLKNILRIGDPKKHRPPHEKEMPESIRKLAGGQPRAPLLSRPPPQYPQQQQRGACDRTVFSYCGKLELLLCMCILETRYNALGTLHTCIHVHFNILFVLMDLWLHELQ